MSTFPFKPCGRSKFGAFMTIFIALISANAFGDNANRFTVARSGEPGGQAIILVAGLASSGDVWDQSLGVLSEYDTHVLTLGGFAGSPSPATINPFLEPAGEALAQYMADLSLTNVLLVGHSMGAQVALVAAGKTADRVSEVLVVDSVPFLTGLMQPGADPIQAAASRDSIVNQMATLPREQFLAFMRQGLPRQARSVPGQTQIMGWIETSDQQAIAHASGDVFAADYRENLDQLSLPITVIIPHDPTIGITAEQVASVYGAQYDRVQDLELRVVSNSRHFVMFDQPESFEKELIRFVQEAGK